jgi:hypothetical protein
VPPQSTVRPLRQPEPDLAVEPVALPGGHRDVARERVEQAQVFVSGVADLPVEPADDSAGEQAGLRYLGSLVGKGIGPGIPSRSSPISS